MPANDLPFDHKKAQEICRTMTDPTDAANMLPTALAEIDRLTYVIDTYHVDEVCQALEHQTAKIAELEDAWRQEHAKSEDRLEELKRVQGRLDTSELYRVGIANERDNARKALAACREALVEERAAVLAFSPDEIVWRYQNNLPDIKSDEDWKPYHEEALAQLRAEGLLEEEP